MFQQTYGYRPKGEEQKTCMQIAEILLLQGTPFSSCCKSEDILRYCCNAGQCQKSNLFPILLKLSLSSATVSQLFPKKSYIHFRKVRDT